MKIVKVLSKKVGETKYFKYLINLPKDIIEKSDLLGKKLKAEVENNKIIIEKE